MHNTVMDKHEFRREKLRELIDTKYDGVDASFSRASGIDPSYVSRMLYPVGKKGKKNIGEDSVEKITNIHPDWLIDESGVSKTEKINPNTTEINIFDSVPVVSWVTAGNFEDVADPYEPGSSDSWLPCPKKHGERTFALRVDGVSMENLGGKYSYSDGDIIFVDPSVQPENGSRVVVRLEGEKQATFKQLIIEGGKKYLKPLNPSWPEKIIQINGNATICGVVIGKWVEE